MTNVQQFNQDSVEGDRSGIRFSVNPWSGVVGQLWLSNDSRKATRFHGTIHIAIISVTQMFIRKD